MKNHLANILTVIGIVVSAWFVVLLFGEYSNYYFMLGLVIFVAVTDLDGKLARHIKIVTNLGKSLDRFRDKLFACPFFYFEIKNIWHDTGLWIGLVKASTGVILGCEFLLIVTWIGVLIKGWDISSHGAGKSKMVLYFVVIGLFFLEKIAGYSDYFVVVRSLLLALAAMYAILSLKGYIERFFPSKT